MTAAVAGFKAAALNNRIIVSVKSIISKVVSGNLLQPLESERIEKTFSKCLTEQLLHKHTWAQLLFIMRLNQFHC